MQHPGSCGSRRQCWRSACRAEWAHLNTIEELRNGHVLAHCHSETYAGSAAFEYRVEMWRYGSETS